MMLSNTNQLIVLIQQIRLYEVGMNFKSHFIETKKIIVCILRENGYTIRECHELLGVSKEIITYYRNSVDRKELKRVKEILNGYIEQIPKV